MQRAGIPRRDEKNRIKPQLQGRAFILKYCHGAWVNMSSTVTAEHRQCPVLPKPSNRYWNMPAATPSRSRSQVAEMICPISESQGCVKNFTQRDVAIRSSRSYRDRIASVHSGDDENCRERGASERRSLEE